ncbi:MAG: hypothetical protein GF308_15585 [Candidatus Heimdallarchaeota archaeon]|nr:hypothetical protein [Candidatus Heimdallarchaeota archaeon]
MKKPKLTLLIPLTLLFVLISSSTFAFVDFSDNAALPAMGYHEDNNTIVLGTKDVGLQQVNEGPWMFSQISGMQSVTLYAYAMDSDVEDADIEPPAGDPDTLYDHGLWKCEWYVDDHLVAQDLTPSDFGYGSIREFGPGVWDLTSTTTKAWLTEAGDYDVYAVIYDLAGNTVETFSIKIWIDPTEGPGFNINLDEMAYMGGDLMYFSTDADPSHTNLVRIDGLDASGDIVHWEAGTNLTETTDYNLRNSAGYIFRYFTSSLMYEMPTWLSDGLYDFTFETYQITGQYSTETVSLIEKDDNPREIFDPVIRHFVPTTDTITYPDGWKEVANSVYKNGDKIEVTIEYEEDWNPNGLDNQNGTLWIDFSAIDTVGTMFQVNKKEAGAYPLGVYYNYTDLPHVPATGQDSFAYNYTIQTAVKDGDYFLPVYSKSILGHYDYIDQTVVPIYIDNTQIAIDTVDYNSPTGIYWNESVMEIDITLVNPDPTAYIASTVGPWGGPQDFADQWPGASTSTFLLDGSNGNTKRWTDQLDEQPDIAKISDSKFIIQWEFEFTSDPTADGFWFINFTVDDQNALTAPVEYVVPFFWDYEVGDLEIWSVRYPDLHPNAEVSEFFGEDVDNLPGTTGADQRLNSKIEVVVTGRDWARPLQPGVNCNWDGYEVFYNDSTDVDWADGLTASNANGLATADGENYVVFDSIPDGIRNLSVKAVYGTERSDPHYLLVGSSDNCMTNYPDNPGGWDAELLDTRAPPQIFDDMGSWIDVLWQASTSQYTVEPVDGWTLAFEAIDNDDFANFDSMVFNDTNNDGSGLDLATPGPEDFEEVDVDGEAFTDAAFGGPLKNTAGSLTNVDWYLFMNSTDENGHASWHRIWIVTDNEFSSASWLGGSDLATEGYTPHDTDYNIFVDATDNEGDIEEIDFYWTEDFIDVDTSGSDLYTEDLSALGINTIDNTYSYDFEDLYNGDYNFYAVPYDAHGHSPLDWDNYAYECNESWYIEKPAEVNITAPWDNMDADGFDNDGNIRTFYGPDDSGDFMGSLANGFTLEWAIHSMNVESTNNIRFAVLNDTDVTNDSPGDANGEWHEDDLLMDWDTDTSFTMPNFNDISTSGDPWRVFVLIRDTLNGTDSEVKTDDNGKFWTMNVLNNSHSASPEHQENDGAIYALMKIEFYIDDVQPIVTNNPVDGGFLPEDVPVELELYSAYKTQVVPDDEIITIGDTIRTGIRVNSTGAGDTTGDDYDQYGDLYFMWEYEIDGDVLALYDYSNTTDGSAIEIYETYLYPSSGFTNPYQFSNATSAEDNAYQHDFTIPDIVNWTGFDDETLTITIMIWDYAMLMAGDNPVQESITVTLNTVQPSFVVDYVDPATQQDTYAARDSIALLVDTNNDNNDNWTVEADFSNLDDEYSAGAENVENYDCAGTYKVTYTLDPSNDGLDDSVIDSGWQNVTFTVKNQFGTAGTGWFEVGVDNGTLNVFEYARDGAKFVPGYLYMHAGMNLTMHVHAAVTTADHIMLGDDSIDISDGYNNVPGLDIQSISGGKADNPDDPSKWYEWAITLNVPADLEASTNWSRMTTYIYGSPTEIAGYGHRGTWVASSYNVWIDNEAPETAPFYDTYLAFFTVEDQYDYTGSSQIGVWRSMYTGTAASVNGYPSWTSGSISFGTGEDAYIDGVPVGDYQTGVQDDGRYYICGTDTWLYGPELLYPSLIGWDTTHPTYDYAGTFSPSAAKPTQMVDVSVTVTDAGAGTDEVEIYIPGIDRWYDLENTAGNVWEGTVNAPQFEGTFNTYLKVTDALGNMGIYYGGPQITVDAEAPGINAFVATDTTPVVGQTVGLTLALDDSTYTVEMFADGTPLTVTQDATNPTVFSATYSQPTAGIVGILATVSDDVWTTSSYLVLEFVEDVDTTKPVITSFSMSDGYTDGNVLFTASFHDNIGVTDVEIAIDGTALTDINVYSGTAVASWTAVKGTHTAKVRVSDAAGNWAEASIAFEIEDRPKTPIDPVYWMGGAIILIMLVGLGLTFLRKGGAA